MRGAVATSPIAAIATLSARRLQLSRGRGRCGAPTTGAGFVVGCPFPENVGSRCSTGVSSALSPLLVDSSGGFVGGDRSCPVRVGDRVGAESTATGVRGGRRGDGPR